MKKNLLFLLISSFSLTALAETKFGAELTLKETVSLEQALVEQKKNSEKVFLIESKVEKVCVKKGCWMSLTTADKSVRVTFKDYGFFVPITLIGKTILVEGTLAQKKLSLSETKHYVKDAGGDPSLIKEAITEYQMVASGLKVKETPESSK
jgi:Domain of unknown function (DUF4920)